MEKGRSLALATGGLWSANRTAWFPLEAWRTVFLVRAYQSVIGCGLPWGRGRSLPRPRPSTSGEVNSPKRRVTVTHRSLGSHSRAGCGVRWHGEGLRWAGQQRLPQIPPYNLLFSCFPQVSIAWTQMPTS